MIKVIDQAALKLICPFVDKWQIRDIDKHPQAINYIDCSELDGNEWECLLGCNPQFADKCTEYNGWNKLSVWRWPWLLMECPSFEDKCTEYGGWAKMDGHEWDWLLSKQPQFAKYKK